MVSVLSAIIARGGSKFLHGIGGHSQSCLESGKLVLGVVDTYAVKGIVRLVRPAALNAAAARIRAGQVHRAGLKTQQSDDISRFERQLDQLSGVQRGAD